MMYTNCFLNENIHVFWNAEFIKYALDPYLQWQTNFLSSEGQHFDLDLLTSLNNITDIGDPTLSPQL